ncbi:pilin [bacterium]|nr:pilin [bacterium]
MQKHFKLLLFCLLFFAFFVVNINIGLSVGGEGIKDCKAKAGEVCLEDPLGHVTPQELIGKIIHAALGIVGSLALVMFIYGGFMWMMAGGNTERVKKGQDTLVWAALGLVIIFSSYALVKFVLGAIGAP